MCTISIKLNNLWHPHWKQQFLKRSTRYCSAFRLDMAQRSNSNLHKWITHFRKSVDNNTLTSIPTVLGKLSMLKSLFIGRNFLTSIPREFTKLLSLGIDHTWFAQHFDFSCSSISAHLCTGLMCTWITTSWIAMKQQKACHHRCIQHTNRTKWRVWKLDKSQFFQKHI